MPLPWFLQFFVASITCLNLFWYYGWIPSAVLIVLLNLLLIIVSPRILNSFFITSGEQPSAESLPDIPTSISNEKKSMLHFPTTPSRKQPKNLFIEHWIRKNPLIEAFKLPLDRIAYLKFKYLIGPFTRYKYDSEISPTFLKKMAQQRWDFTGDECHPICLITDLSETYLEYRAYLYNMRFANRAFSTSSLVHECSPDCWTESSHDCPRRMSLIPSQIPQEERLDPKEIAKGFESTEEVERWDSEFRERIEESRQKLESAQMVFSIMRQSKREAPSSAILSEKDTTESTRWCSFSFFKKKK